MSFESCVYLLGKFSSSGQEWCLFLAWICFFFILLRNRNKRLNCDGKIDVRWDLLLVPLLLSLELCLLHENQFVLHHMVVLEHERSVQANETLELVAAQESGKWQLE